MSALPEKLSELVRVAASALKEVQDDPRYRFDRAAWHAPYRGRCEVCVAGAVIAKVLDYLPDQAILPSDTLYRPQLLALNELAYGNVRKALRQLRVPLIAEQVRPFRAGEPGGTCEEQITYLETVAEKLEGVGL